MHLKPGLQWPPYPPQGTSIQSLEGAEDLDGIQRLLWKHEVLEQEMRLIQAQVEVSSWR